jgi:DNA-binding transcriptional MerR regulator
MNDTAKKIIELRKQGIPLKKIEKLLGCSRSTVSKWCATLAMNGEIITQNILNRRPNHDRQHEIRLLSHLVTRGENDARRVWTIQTRIAAKNFLVLAGGKKCQICGYSRCLDNMVFHHINPALKDFDLNGMRLTYSLERIIEEAKKCALLCRNCHGELHAGWNHEVSPISFNEIEIPRSLIEWWLTLQKTSNVIHPMPQ